MEADHPLITLLLCACLLVPLAAQGHPFHASHGEMEWSSDGRTLDVAIQVIPEDLEAALSAFSGTSVVLVDGDEHRDIIEGYLRKHFRLQHGQNVATLSFLGKELKAREVWLYFSCGLQPGEDLRLRHTLLMDQIPRQHNHLRPLWLPPAESLVFTAEEPEHAMPVYLGD